MIDLSKLKSPGWQRVVGELNAAAPDDRTFLLRLLAVLGQVASARQAVLLSIPPAGDEGASPEPRVLSVWPPPATEPQNPSLEEGAEVRNAAQAAVESGQVRAFGLEQEETYYDGGRGRGSVVAVPLGGAEGGSGVAPRLVIMLLLDSRSPQAMQTTLAIIEILAGYVHAHAARQQLKMTRAAGAALDLAGRLIAAVNNSKGFKGATLQIVNDLSRQLGADRVALGWVKGVGDSGVVRLKAVSDTEHLDRRMALSQKLEAAMDECLDQEQAVVYPPPPAQGENADALLGQAITHAHRELVAADANLKVASVPLRVDERVLGVLTVESAAEGSIDATTVELLQSAMDLVSPVLRLRRSDDRAVPVRAWHSTLSAASWAVGTRHTAWKLAGLAVMAAAVTVTFVRVPYRVEATMELRPREQRKIAAPLEGILRTLPEGIIPGAKVEEGQTLAQIDTTELRLQLAEAQGAKVQAQARADDARNQRKGADETQALAEVEQAEARMALLRKKIEDATITAPISGIITAGDLRERVGSALKMGDLLMEIAQLDDMIVVARVGDRDIKLIQEAHRPGEAPGHGEIATKAYPARPYAFTVERIVPLAQAEQGKNEFEVYGDLAGSAGWMRPGMEGIAKFNTGDRTLIDIGTRRIRDTLRLWLWW